MASNTKLITHLGYTKVKNFRMGDTLDYKLGVLHTRWGFDFEADVVGGRMRNDYYGMTVDKNGNIKHMDRTALVASIAKRF